MKREHTKNFVIKIADEYRYTPQKIMNQVKSYTGRNMNFYDAIDYLKQFDAETIRFILGFNNL